MTWAIRMTKMNIGQRLWLGFGAVCAVLVLAVGFTFLRVSAADGRIEAVATVNQPVVEASSHVESNLYRSLADLRGALLTGAEEYAVERKRAWVEIGSDMDHLDTLLRQGADPADMEAWGRGRAALDELRTVQDEVERYAIVTDNVASEEKIEGQEGRRGAGVLILKRKAVPLVQASLDILIGRYGENGRRAGGLLDRQRTNLHAALTDARRLSGNLLDLQIILLIVGLCVTALVALLSVRSIVGPVDGITRTMTVLATGDTSAEIPGGERTDEIGEMARAVVVFRDNMIQAERLRAEQTEVRKQAEQARRALMLQMAERFEASVKGIVDATSTAATELQGTSTQLAQTAEQGSHQAAVVSAAAEETCSSVQTVAAATEELSASITEITRQIHDAAGQTRKVADDAQLTDAVIGRLADTAQRIGEIVALINDIANQTNLLALNATIEAARAGDAGKGFAVVANEVKHLASQTSKATDEIGAQVKGIQQAVGEAVEAVGKIVAAVSGVNQITTTIAASAEEQAAATGEITRSVSHAAQGTQQVSNNIGGVQRASSDTGAAAGAVQSSASQLARMAGELSVAVDVFLGEVKAA